MKKRILCFGDSNTWGYNPTGGRYDEEDRWPMVLQSALGDRFHVVEEGFNGRTFSQDDPTEGGFKSAVAYLPPCLMTHNPIDVAIVMLGTNDTKTRFGLNAVTIAHNLNEIVRLIRAYATDGEGNPPKILIVSPPEIAENIGETLMLGHFGPDAPDKSRHFYEQYRKYALLLKCDLLNAAEFAKPSRIDAIHLTREGQHALGRAIYEKIKNML